MKISIVIVNYNVKYFLEQCLYSVRHASTGLNVEVFVVDNNSVDNSVAMVREKFPEATVIANKENLGFSKANNQAIKISTGEYVLLLNPDTVLEDDTLVKICNFMDEHPDAGGLGVKMIDGKGHFLPESKRGLPTPRVAFYKIFGLSKIFPRSRIFGKYHLGYLDKEEIHEVDVLAGAFMLLRKSVLDEIGYLDEAFFMYGEDIDLSYRITKAGYKNYYFPETRIIHYKGESTKKSSINYVFVFYNAMIIFARKHFSQKNARLFSILIKMAIYFRASLAIFVRFFSRAFLPILDFILLYTGIYLITSYWEKHVIFTDGGSYPIVFITLVVPVYILVWLLSTFLSAGYDRPARLRKITQGIIIGTVIILVAYALLPEKFRFSRAIILLSALWGIIAMTGTRIILHLSKLGGVRINSNKNRRFIIIGDKDEAPRVSELLKKSILNPGIIILVDPGSGARKEAGSGAAVEQAGSTAMEQGSDPTPDSQFLGNSDQVSEIIDIYKIDEVIFCSKSLPHSKIIDMMSELHDARVDYKIAPEDSLSIIGSNSIDTAGDLYTVTISSISKASNKRNKRFLDLLTGLFLLLTLPVNIFIIKHPAALVRNILLVIFGRKTWVGYCKESTYDVDRLPHIRDGILTPADAIRRKDIPGEALVKLNFVYARDYHFLNDLNIILKGYRKLGRTK